MRIRYAAIIAVGLWSLPAVAADKIDAKPAAGTKVGFRVHVSSQNEFEFGDRANKSSEERVTDYVLTFQKVGDDGAMEIEVTVPALKVSSSGRGSEVDFDSAKKAEGEDDEVAAYLRKITSSKMTVKVDAEGSVESVDGLERFQSAEGGQDGGGRGGFGRRGPRAPVSEFTVRSDLTWIIGTGLRGKELEAGKTYSLGASFGPGGPGGPGAPGGRGGFRRGGDQGGDSGGRRPRRPEGDDSLLPGGEDETTPVAAQDDERPRRGRGQGGAGSGQDRPGQGQGRGGQGRGFRGFGPREQLRFESAGKAGDADVLTFAVLERPRGFFGRGGDQDAEPTVTGKVHFSKADGLLWALESKSEGDNSSDRGSMSWKNALRITRIAVSAGAAKAKTF